MRKLIVGLLVAASFSTPLMARTLRLETPRAFAPLLYPSRYKGVWGGRGSAKSHFFAELAIETALLEPTRLVCIREVQKSLEQSVKRLLEDKIKHYKLENEFRITNTHINCPNEGIFIFQGMQDHTADSIKSLEGFNRAWVEEAQSLSDHSLTLLRPTIFRRKGSEIWFSWNPRSADDPVDKFLRGTPAPPDAIVIGTTYKDNPWFPDELRKEMEWDKARDYEKYEHVWEGKYETHSEARVFKNFRVEEFETPRDVIFYFGADWGFTIDPSVLVRMYIVGRTLYIDHEAYQIGCEIDHLPALFDKVPQSRRFPITADSARPETISYLQRNGFPQIKGAIKGAGSVEEGINFLQSFDVVIHPRCVHVADEFKNYKFKVDQRTGLVSPVLEDKRNHTIDSCRYALEEQYRYVPEGGVW